MLNAVALGGDNLIFYVKNVNQTVCPFSVNVSYKFFFCAAAAEASAIEEVGSGEIDLELGSSFLNRLEKNLGAVIVK